MSMAACTCEAPTPEKVRLRDAFIRRFYQRHPLKVVKTPHSTPGSIRPAGPEESFL
jgi:hypothetical protein